MNLGYGSGPLSASVVVQDVKKDGAAAVPDTRTVQLGGAYDFGVAKGFLQYGEVKNNTTGNSYDITGIGARVPVGTGAVLVQWGQIAPKTGADRQTLSVGYSHALSKRTDAYVATMYDKVDNLSSGGGYSVGLRHRF
jgi:predicted porin